MRTILTVHLDLSLGENFGRKTLNRKWLLPDLCTTLANTREAMVVTVHAS